MKQLNLTHSDAWTHKMQETGRRVIEKNQPGVNEWILASSVIPEN